MKTLEIKITFKLPESDSILSLLESIAYKTWALILRGAGAVVSYSVSYSDSLTMVKIHNTVSHHTGIPKDDMLKDTRKQEIVEARQIAMALSKEMIKPKPSLNEIGFYFGDKDHATVLHACKVTQNHIDTEKKFSQKIEKIRQSLLT